MKKWMLIVIIAILFAATILIAFLLNTPKVKYVDMKYFNKTIEEMKTKITDNETEINTLIGVNVDLQEQVEVANNNNKSLAKEIANIKRTINNNNTTLNNKINNTEASIVKLQNWDRTYVDALLKGFTNSGIYRYMNNYMKAQ